MKCWYTDWYILLVVCCFVAQAADSWAILDTYGNMLSPSVMFVLERIFKRHKEALARGEEGYKMGLAFSFSPGVGAEGIMLKQVK